MRVAHLVTFVAAAFIACSNRSDNDQPAQVDASPLGAGLRLRDVQNPTNAISGQTVSVTTVVVSAVDNFDETRNGKSRGTIFVQDVDQVGPYAGISLYAPAFVPANLRLAPGDVIDMNGQYSEQHTIGSTVNFGASFLPQMNKPQVQQRFEMQLPAPLLVQLSDLEQFSDSNGGARRFLGMLVQLKDVTVPSTPAPSDSTGLRVTAPLTNVTNGPALNNELWDLKPNAFPAGTHFSSITGIVDFFFNVYIAPRSAADLVQ